MVTITEPPVLIASIVNQTNITCDNPIGSATASGSGGTPSYSFNWSSGGTNATETFSNPGTYTVSVVDDNFCVDTETVTITQDIVPPATNAGPDGQLDCNTPILVLNGSPSGGQYSLLWTTVGGNIISGETTPNPTVNAAGTYTLTVTDLNNGCTASDDAVVTEIAEITLFISGIDVTCNGGNDGSINLTVTGGQSPYSFDWNDDSLDGMEDPSGLAAGNYCVTVTDDAACMETICIDILEPAQISLSATLTHISCFGICDGSITLDASGGTSPYTFDWIGPNGYAATTANIDDLCPGDYTVNVTDDNGCTTSDTYTINEPSEIELSATINNATCNGICDGSITLSVSGGTSPYTFEWVGPNNYSSNTQNINNLCPGDYTVTITDANGCTAVATYTVSEPDPLTASATFTPPTCNGECDAIVDVSVTGGTPPYTYEWDGPCEGPNPQDVCAGTFTVTITDANSCTTSVTVTVTEPDALDLELSSTDETTPGANDGSATATVTGGTPTYTYEWDTSPPQITSTITGLAPGTYCVTVTDANDCTISGCVVVNAGNCDLTATVTPTDVSCNGGNDGMAEAVPSGGTMPYNYNWSSGGNESTENNLSAGSYSVTITDANDCEVIVNFTINEPSALVLEMESTDETTNGAMDGTATANVTGGTQPYSYLWDDANNSTTQTIENLSAGNYCVTVTDDNGCTISGCVTVNPGGCDLEGEIATVDVSCNGGSDGLASVTATGGTPPYTYAWSSGGNETMEDSLSAGSYMVTIFDSNGCCIIINFVISEPAQFLQVATSVDNVTCNGDCDGNIALTVTGGTQPYTFEWSNGSTVCDIPDACSGTYSVTVTDANGCSITAEATVTEPPALELTMSSTDETAEGANDGTATAEAMGGTPGYTYLWDNSQTTSTIVDLPTGTYCVTVTDLNGCTITGCTVVNSFGCDLSLEISDENFTCVDDCNGSIDLTVIGGEEPFNYEWSSEPIGNVEDPIMLCMGNYTVTVTDNNGCSASISTSVVEAPVMILSLEYTSPPCLELCTGEIDLSVEGGAAPYAYLWSNGETTEDIDSLCFDLYQITVTDSNGCTKIGVPTIEVPTSVSIFEDVTDNSCFGSCDGSISIIVSDAEEPIDYDWSDDNLDGIEDPVNLCAGSYELTVTDVNGCSASVLIFVNEPAEMVIFPDPVDASCFEECDGFVNITVTGGTLPYSFSGPIDNLCAGTYTITVTDSNGCTAIESFDINEPDVLVITVDEIGHEMNTQADGFINVTIEGGTPDFEYNWKLDGNTISTDEDPTGLGAGSYTLEVTDANGCLVSTEDIVVDNIVGVVDHNLKNFINVFPNPTNGFLQIEFDLNKTQFVEIEVFDFTGKKILEIKKRDIRSQKLPIDLAAFSEGVYTLKINIGKAFLIERIVKHD